MLRPDCELREIYRLDFFARRAPVSCRKNSFVRNFGGDFDALFFPELSSLRMMHILFGLILSFRCVLFAAAVARISTFT